MSNTSGNRASWSGKEWEKEVKIWLKRRGFTLLKTRKEFHKFFGKEEGERIYLEKVKLFPPKSWKKDGYKQEAYFLDGWIVEIDRVIQIRGGSKIGTTLDKVFLELGKLIMGVYNTNSPIFLFVGSNENADQTIAFETTLRILRPTITFSGIVIRGFKNFDTFLQKEMKKAA